MSNLLYIGAVIGTAGFGALVAVVTLNTGRFYGRTISQWVQKNRKKKDEVTAEKIIQLRKRLEILAHDVLKHRILGLDTLFKESRPRLPSENSTKNNEKNNEKNEEYLKELFRLCGIQANHEERLWTKLRSSLKEITLLCGRMTSLPMFDPMFRRLIMVVNNLQRTVWLYFNKMPTDSINKRLAGMDLSCCLEVYQDVLQLADACRMEIDMDSIVQQAIKVVSSQTHRTDISDHIHIYGIPKQRLLCTAPTHTLVTCLIRLIDNAFEQNSEVAIDIVHSVDEFTGEASLIIKVYDTCGDIPSVSAWGMGLKGIKESLDTFSGGIQYRQEDRDNYKKAAVVSLPVSECTEFHVTKRPFISNFVGVAVTVIAYAGFIICLVYALGGPPVEFAGKGEKIVEFSVQVGETLDIPLCNGGRNVRVELHDANNACVADDCSFHQVLMDLEPCSRSLDDPQCSGAIHWVPQFRDGQRQGKNYEISVHCISDGPPYSEDLQRIRLIVFRPNSRPVPVLVELTDETKGETHYLRRDQNVFKVDVNDRLRLRVLANDADSDPLTYTLKHPNGTILSTADGIFDVRPDWSLFGTSTFEIGISDRIDTSVTFPIVFQAERLHPIELRNISMWTDDKATQSSCEGSSETRICRLVPQQTNELTIQLWFDPLQKAITPRIGFNASDTASLDVRSIRVMRGKTSIGDQWEIYSRGDSSVLMGFVELTNIEPTADAGLFNYTFSITPTPDLPPAAQLAVNLNVSERGHRMPELNTLIIMTYHQPSGSEISFSTRSIKLTEYEMDEDAGQASASVWIYPQKSDRSTSAPVIDSIVCQTPGFEQAILPPTVHSLGNAWRVDFRLRRGCIQSLRHTLTNKQKLCAVNVHFDTGQKADEVIWLMLQDRPCSPVIESFDLISTSQDHANNLYKWSFLVQDPDGDVTTDDFSIVGTSNYSMQLASKSGDSTTYNGMVSVQASCDMAAPKIYLRIQDKAAHVITKQINIPLDCPPIVTTFSDEDYFEVDEGDMLDIPLQHGSDVSLALNSHFGDIVEDSFVWKASCRYGRGPHSVEIAGTSPTHYGKPLRFEVYVTHCRPRFSLYLDNTMIQPDVPILMRVDEKKDLHITTSYFDSTPFIAQIHHSAADIQLVESDAADGHHIAIECIKPDTSDVLQIQISSDTDEFNDIPMISIPIECISE